ncbi:FAD-binding domain-containing protein [Ceraceosorus guamensis]|uniref:FAD-binding domain-containing protein n=1 Tax=Ceraceosorus guamensis TaxID=1522189 RepID=A0A316W835_9BASI|nr:FAD-binding domain-containing protein [Ceraceosorus guamensis]PWN45992.1 FAD-binding domain-containing protein [Ceraceosorus guamensis]
MRSDQGISFCSIRNLAAILLIQALLSLSTSATPAASHRARALGAWPPGSGVTYPYERSVLSPDRVARAVNWNLASCLEGASVPYASSRTNSTDAYWDAAQSDNLRYHFHPSAIAYPRDHAGVEEAVRCATRAGNTAVSARSGGHSFAGFGSGGQDGSLVIDLGAFDKVVYDAGKQTAQIGPGTRLGDVVKELWKQGKAGMPHGTCPPVGTGGHALCGGFGPTSRKWGMATDNILSAEVVLANGTSTHVSATSNPELWWGLRGAGSFFGIVTSFEFKTYNVDSPMVFLEYRWSPSIKSADDTVSLVEAVQAFSLDQRLPAELGFHLQFQRPNGGDPSGGTISIHMRGMFSGDLQTYKPHVERLFAELASHNAPRPDMSTEKQMDYLTIMEEWDDFGSPGDKLDTLAERLVHNSFIARTSLSMGQKGFTHQSLLPLMQLMWDDMKSRQDPARPFRNWGWNLYMEMFGGANARHRDADLIRDSSFPHRDGLWLMQSSIGTAGFGQFGDDARQMLDKLDDVAAESMRASGLDRRSYSCYVDPNLSEEQWRSLYYGDAIPRLEKLKSEVDPTNLFRNPQSLVRKVPNDPHNGQIKISHPLPRSS